MRAVFVAGSVAKLRKGQSYDVQPLIPTPSSGHGAAVSPVSFAGGGVREADVVAGEVGRGCFHFCQDRTALHQGVTAVIRLFSRYCTSLHSLRFGVTTAARIEDLGAIAASLPYRPFYRGIVR